jgi:uncharacterized membrane protein YfcA
LETLITWAVVMLGALMQGMTGLGFALIAVPALILFQDPRTVISTTLLLQVLLNGLILYQARDHITLREAGPLTLGTLLGVPFGSYLLTVISVVLLKQLVAVLVLLFSIPLLLGYSRAVGFSRVASLTIGAVAGALQGSTGMGSPPVVLFMANQGLSKESFRGMLVFRSMAASALSVVALMPSGVMNSGIALNALLLAPALLVGFVLGSRLLKLVPQRLFVKVAVLLVAGTAMASLMGTLLGGRG